MANARAAPVASSEAASIDLPTIAAIAVCSYLLSSVFHEVLGHGLVALLLGGKIEYFSSVELAWDSAGSPEGVVRAVAAAGCAANVVFGLAALAALGAWQSRLSPSERYFTWLLGHTNLFVAGGYAMVLSFVSFGDWHTFTQGLPSPTIWRLGLTVVGILVSFATLVHAMRTLDPFLGPDRGARGRRAASLTLFPYLVGGVISTVASLSNPGGVSLVLISAVASSFGGTAFLGWAYFWVKPVRGWSSRDNPLTPTRGRWWLVSGIIAVVIYVLVLGPGLPR